MGESNTYNRKETHQMKKCILLCLVCILGLAAWAQQQLNADQVLSRCSAKLYEAPAIMAAFRASAGQTSVEGEMTISHEKFKMATSDYSVWYDGANMWSYYKSNGETYLSAPTMDELLEINPFVILNNFKNNYSAKVVQHQGGKYTLQMVPLSKTSQIKQATVTIDSSSWLPSSVTATFANDARVNITILSTTLINSAPALSTFVYPAKDYPSVEVIDLR